MWDLLAVTAVGVVALAVLIRHVVRAFSGFGAGPGSGAGGCKGCGSGCGGGRPPEGPKGC